MDSETFLEASIEIFQLTQALVDEFVFGLKGATDLVCEFLHLVRIPDETRQQAGKKISSSLRASDNEQCRVDYDLILLEVVLLCLLLNVPDEILVLSVSVLQTLKALFATPNQMLTASCTNVLWYQTENERLSERTRSCESSRGLFKRTDLHSLINECYPLVESAFIQAAEGIAKGQVADDIKSCEIEPGRRILVNPP